MSSRHRRRYRVNSESWSKLTKSDISPISKSSYDLSSIEASPPTLTGDSGTKSVREVKKRSNSFSRKRLSSLFATIAGHSSSSNTDQQPVSLESYRPLSQDNQFDSITDFDQSDISISLPHIADNDKKVSRGFDIHAHVDMISEWCNLLIVGKNHKINRI